MTYKAILSSIGALLLLCGTFPAVTHAQTVMPEVQKPAAHVQKGSIHGTVVDP